MATEHFTDFELACRCSCGLLPSDEFQEQLELLRVEYGHPMRLSSAARCPDYNDDVSSTGRNGPHTIGAIDVLVWGGRYVELLGAAHRLGWTGYGTAQKGPREIRFLHLDRLDGPLRPWGWSY